MHPKITSEHLGRGAVVYVRQSTMGQVAEHTESRRRQYALAESARSLGFASVTVIDDDLGRSGSGLVERPAFQKLVASVCSGVTGAVFCIEASRLARNGRDWPPAAMRSSIRPNGWSPANSRPGGTRRWSGSPISMTASLGMTLPRRFARRSIARH